MTYITQPEITYTNCPQCDLIRPFLASAPAALGLLFTCLGCGNVYDDEGDLVIHPASPPWRDRIIALAYLEYRDSHDQFRRYPDPGAAEPEANR